MAGHESACTAGGVLIPNEGSDSQMTTIELLSGRDGVRLRQSIRELEEGGGIEHDLIE